MYKNRAELYTFVPFNPILQFNQLFLTQPLLYYSTEYGMSAIARARLMDSES